MQKINAILAVSVILFCLLGATPAGWQQVCFKERCFSVELVVTPEERAQGLMFRKQLDSEKGMLFIFPDEQLYPFWMKQTYIPLDIIWLNQDKEVVFIKANAQPCLEEHCPVIEPDRVATYVLEINAGWVEAMQMKIGDRVNFFID